MTDMDEIRGLLSEYADAVFDRGAASGAADEVYPPNAGETSSRSALLQRVEALREERDAKEVEAAKADSWRQAAETYRRERDDLREAAKLAWAFCHEAQQRITVDDDFRARAEVAFSLLDRVLYPPGYPASSATGVCWDCQVGGPDAGPCSKCAPAPPAALRPTTETKPTLRERLDAMTPQGRVAVAQRLTGLMREVEERDRAGLCDRCDGPGGVLHAASGIRLCAKCAPTPPENKEDPNHGR